MTATEALTEDLKKQVIALEDDLRRRVDEDPALREEWHRTHRQATEKERTAWSWVQWRDDRVNQTAVAWVLMTVFIRFCEDNALVKPVWITGPGRRRQEALDAELEFSVNMALGPNVSGSKMRSRISANCPRRRPWSTHTPRSATRRRPVTPSRN